MYRSMLKDEKFGQMFQNDEPPAAQALCKGSLAAGWGLKAHVLGRGMVSIRLTHNSVP